MYFAFQELTSTDNEMLLPIQDGGARPLEPPEVEEPPGNHPRDPPLARPLPRAAVTEKQG